jgi:hypothetical protein
MDGDKITTVEDIVWCAKQKKSLCCREHKDQKPTPAAIFLNMQVAVVLNRIEHGLYIYTPKEKRKNYFTIIKEKPNE